MITSYVSIQEDVVGADDGKLSYHASHDSLTQLIIGMNSTVAGAYYHAGSK
jgi:hypothetical protein